MTILLLVPAHHHGFQGVDLSFSDLRRPWPNSGIRKCPGMWWFRQVWCRHQLLSCWGKIISLWIGCKNVIFVTVTCFMSELPIQWRLLRLSCERCMAFWDYVSSFFPSPSLWYIFCAYVLFYPWIRFLNIADLPATANTWFIYDVDYIIR